MRTVFVSLLTACALGCAVPQNSTQAPAPACAAPASATAFDSSRSDALAGDYTLILTADSFPSVGAHTVGRLRLRANSDTQRPLVGTLDINLDAIFAPYSIDPRSTNPNLPGVYFNSHAFEIGVQPNITDGTSTALIPTLTWPDGFSGRWSPNYGIVSLHNAKGQPAFVGGAFCAMRRK